MTELEHYIQTYFGVSDNELKEISRFFKPIQVKKGEYYLKAGGYSKQLGFVQSGILREYVLVEDKEITKWISTKGYFAVDLASFIFSQPARWSIQALSDCELYVINEEEYRAIGKVIPQWSELEKLFIAKCFAALEERIVQHLSLSAEERYVQLFKTNKELFNQVPLQFLASMLGMAPETLSRLRKSVVI